MLSDYANAISVQSAVNLSGVVFAFSKVIARAQKDHAAAGCSHTYASHPVLQMFAAAIVELCRTGVGDFDTFEKNHHFCQAMAKYNVKTTPVRMVFAESVMREHDIVDFLGKKWLVGRDDDGYGVWPLEID